jgi:ribosomal protein S18 acetylase RimI-like enzyme
MVEITRIRADEAETVTRLWDESAQGIPDGGPLTERGARNITRMLRASATHLEVFCLVARDGSEIVGFVVGQLTRSPVLPGVAGEVQEHYVVPSARGAGISRGLAETAVTRLRRLGAGVIWTHVCVDDREAHEFWRAVGFEGDTTRFALYG